jgi:hypothetical protein
VHYTENDLHFKLKNLSKEYLLAKGFKPEEIHEEYIVQLPHGQLRVDVAGVSPVQSIAIECGQTQADKLPLLKFYFDQVIHVPYGTLLLTEERLKIETEYNKSLEEIKKTQPKIIGIKDTDIYKQAQRDTYELFMSRCRKCDGYKDRPKIFRSRS